MFYVFLLRGEAEKSEKFDQMEGGIEEDGMSATLSSQVYFSQSHYF